MRVLFVAVSALSVGALAEEPSANPCPNGVIGCGFRSDRSSRFATRDGWHEFCDLDILQPSELTVELFREKYEHKAPVVLNTTLSDWTTPAFWTRHAMERKLGAFPFQTGFSHELVLNSGVGKSTMNLSQYLDTYMSPHRGEPLATVTGDSEPLYLFDRTIWRESAEELAGFQQLFESPAIGPNLNETVFENDASVNFGILTIGSTGTGAAMHSHGVTWLGLAQGRKRWQLYPPEMHPPGGFWPSHGSLDWMDLVYPSLDAAIATFADDWLLRASRFIDADDSEETRSFDLAQRLVDARAKAAANGDCQPADGGCVDLRAHIPEWRRRTMHGPLECMQPPGTTLYLPEFWFHSVLNVGDVVAGAIQGSDSFGELMLSLDNVPMIEKTLHRKRAQDVDVRAAETGQLAIEAQIARVLSLGSARLSLSQKLTRMEEDALHFALLKVHREMLAMAPTNAVHWFFVGYEFAKLKSFREATAVLKKAIQLDPVFVEAYITLARNLRELAEAIESQSKYLRSAARKVKAKALPFFDVSLRSAEEVAAELSALRADADKYVECAFALSPRHPDASELFAAITQKRQNEEN